MINISTNINKPGYFLVIHIYCVSTNNCQNNLFEDLSFFEPPFDSKPDLIADFSKGCGNLQTIIHHRLFLAKFSRKYDYAFLNIFSCSSKQTKNYYHWTSASEPVAAAGSSKLQASTWKKGNGRQKTRQVRIWCDYVLWITRQHVSSGRFKVVSVVTVSFTKIKNQDFSHLCFGRETWTCLGGAVAHGDHKVWRILEVWVQVK